MTKTNFMMTDQYITMIKGDTLAFGVEIFDQFGVYMDIDEAYFTCKKSYSDNVPTFQKSMNNGISKDDTGRYRVRVAPDDTKNIEYGRYFYDFQVRKDEDVFTIMRGVLDIEQDVTTN